MRFSETGKNDNAHTINGYSLKICSIYLIDLLYFYFLFFEEGVVNLKTPMVKLLFILGQTTR